MRSQIHSQIVLLVAMLGGTAQAGAQVPQHMTRDPRSAILVYEDLDRFAAVYARLTATGDTLPLLDSAYLARATEGLRVYGSMYSVDAVSLREALRRQPRRYALTAQLGPELVRAIEPDVRQAMSRLREYYPDAVFPPVYYLVGPHRAGGAVQREGVFIGVETYAAPTAEAAADQLPRLVHLVAHELVHFQQAAWNVELYQSSNSLLARAIREGVADFIAELVSGRHINAAAHAYGDRHERELWHKFRREMDGTATGEWFFVQPADSALPQDLGYYIGYRIARSRFLREPDPRAGVTALIRIADYERFLEQSGYDLSLGGSNPPGALEEGARRCSRRGRVRGAPDR